MSEICSLHCKLLYKNADSNEEVVPTTPPHCKLLYKNEQPPQEGGADVQPPQFQLAFAKFNAAVNALIPHGASIGQWAPSVRGMSLVSHKSHVVHHKLHSCRLAFHKLCSCCLEFCKPCCCCMGCHSLCRCSLDSHKLCSTSMDFSTLCNCHQCGLRPHKLHCHHTVYACDCHTNMVGSLLIPGSLQQFATPCGV